MWPCNATGIPFGPGAAEQECAAAIYQQILTATSDLANTFFAEADLCLLCTRLLMVTISKRCAPYAAHVQGVAWRLLSTIPHALGSYCICHLPLLGASHQKIPN